MAFIPKNTKKIRNVDDIMLDWENYKFYDCVFVNDYETEKGVWQKGTIVKIIDWVIDNIGNQKIISLIVELPGTNIGDYCIPVEYLEVIEN